MLRIEGVSQLPYGRIATAVRSYRNCRTPVSQLPYARIATAVRPYRNCHTLVHQLGYGL
ncbi:MAG: hypothetical protein MR216_00165 [Bacteroidales bacterium]|nr:hypothetical protein [Bacteroidales bacterium]